MKSKNKIVIPAKAGIQFLLFFGLCITLVFSQTEESVSSQIKKPKYVKGIHLTSWISGSKKARKRIDSLLKDTELNTVVIDIKEIQGEVYIPGVSVAEELGLYVKAIPDLKDYLAQLKKDGVYIIARMVVFKDNGFAKKKPSLAVKNSEGSIWEDRKKNSWTDPYNSKVWDYNLDIAARAVELGFDEIQFDYIRFPSDGNIKQCRYSYEEHNSSSAARALSAFLSEASKRLKPMGANLSIDLFGLTPSVNHGMGIGQKITEMTHHVDFVSPMVYPSHYAKGEYGIEEPNKYPYPVVFRTMSDAKKRFNGEVQKLRPYLQDFSLGVKYGPKEVRAQILACENLGIKEWLLWNPSCIYTKDALKSKDGVLLEAAEIPESMTIKPEKKDGNNNSSAITKNGSKEKILTIPKPNE